MVWHEADIQIVRMTRFRNTLGKGGQLVAALGGWLRIGGALALCNMSALPLCAAQVVLDSGKPYSFAPGQRRGWDIDIHPDWAVLTVKTRMRATDIVCGKLSWMNGRTAMSFRDKDDKLVGGWPSVFGFDGTTHWQDCERDYRIPEGAVKFKVSLGNWGVSGMADFESFTVSVKRLKTTGPGDAPLPDGAPLDSWSLDGAQHRKTATRERWCLNGLWGVRPSLKADVEGRLPKPGDCWGWEKIPSVWGNPDSWGNSDIHSGRRWQERIIAPWLEDNPQLIDGSDRVWYRREFVMPRETAGKKVVLTFTMLNTRAVVYVDGERAAEAMFPGGEADITRFVKPGAKQTIVLDVTAYPLSKDTFTFNAPDRSDKKAARVKYKGVTGDVYLDAYPVGVPRIADATVECDVKGRRAKFAVDVEGLGGATGAFKLAAKVRGVFAGATSRDFRSGLLSPDAEGRLCFDAQWHDVALWDSHTPQNLYDCTMELCDAEGRVLDAALPFRFGFRDVCINGRDLLLNGVPLHLRALHNHTMNAAAGIACAESARKLIGRLKSEGFNFIIAGNYNFSPGEMSYMDALLDECDKSGMLFSFSLPHYRDFDFGKKPPKGTVVMEMPENAMRYRDMAQLLQ